MVRPPSPSRDAAWSSGAPWVCTLTKTHSGRPSTWMFCRTHVAMRLGVPGSFAGDGRVLDAERDLLRARRERERALDHQDAVAPHLADARALARLVGALLRRGRPVGQ